jgi:radical SAM superfamily enzyme YgiQ (UPF0313 family)
LRIQLFNPPVNYYAGMSYIMNPPLGLPILCAVLREAGHEVEVADLEAKGYNPEKLAQAYAAQRDSWPDVIGFTSLNTSARGVRDCIQALRGIGYAKTIVVGGVYATLEPETVLNYGADLVITGECEGNIAYALETGARGVIKGVPAPIENIPAPDWEHFSPDNVRYPGNAPHLVKPEAISMWSRGCPHRCIFCGNEIFKHQPIRYRKPAHIEEELRLLRDTGVRGLFVYDDELVGLPMPEGWMDDVCKRIEPLGLQWKAQGRVSRKHISEELMHTMYAGGCRVLMWGVESLSQKVLNNIRKGTKVEDTFHTLEMAKKAGIKNWIFTMVGNYGETVEDLEITEKGLRELYSAGLVDYRQTTAVTPLPNTELWEIAKKEGWLVPPPDTGAYMAHAHADTSTLTGEEIEYWIQRLGRACPVGF